MSTGRFRVTSILFVTCAFVVGLLASPLSAHAATKPTPPQNVKAVIAAVSNATDVTAVISWAAPANNGGYPIGAYQIAVTPSFTGSSHSTNGTTLSYTMSGFKTGTSYTISVKATNTYDTTSDPATITFKPLDRPTSPLQVAAQVVAVNAGLADVRVTWQPPAHDGGTAITQYVVSSQSLQSCTAPGNQLACTLSGFAPGSQHLIRVYAANSVGTSAQPGELQYTVPNVPGAPGGITPTVAAIQGSTGIVHVAWQSPASNGGSAITAFKVTASPGGATCSTTGAVSCNLAGLTAGVGYSIVVTASNIIGTGPAAATNFSFAAVTPAPTTQPTPPPTASPTATPSPTPEATPSQMPSPVATPTEAVTATATAAATPSEGAIVPTSNSDKSGPDPLLIVAVLVAFAACAIGLAFALGMRRSLRASRVAGGAQSSATPAGSVEPAAGDEEPGSHFGDEM